MPNQDVQEYVADWPDECVGSFARCYSLEKDKAVYLQFVCDQGWELPQGTTHLSVNCTADYNLFKIESDPKYGYEIYAEQDREMMHEMAIIGFVFIGFLTAMCLVCCVFGYYWIVRPYTTAMREASTSEGEELLTTEESTGVQAQIT